MTTRVLEGHVLDALRSLPSNTFQCVATSPPYYGLRDYGLPAQVWGGEQHEHEWGPVMGYTGTGRVDQGRPITAANAVNWSRPEPKMERSSQGTFCACSAWLGSLGLEPTPELYVEHLVSVFREVRRVLRPDGCIFVNLGDSYAGSGKGPTGWNGVQNAERRQGFADGPDLRARRSERPREEGCKPKDLLGMPWMVAFALRADGWYLRAEIIWSKPNPMPESVTDRPTKAHETVFLLAKSRTYFYDADAIREEAVMTPQRRFTSSSLRVGVPGQTDHNGVKALRDEPEQEYAGRNKRSVWEIATAPFPNAHFATFPPKLVEPMLLAGTSEKGCCPECGKPWERVTQPAHVDPDPSQRSTAHYNTAERYGARNGGNGGFDLLAAKMRAGEHGRQTAGWRPTCAHDAAPVPCQVLDPFAGAGTTLLVASRLGRDSVGIELNPNYAQMARSRIYDDAPLFFEETGA